MCCIKCSSYRYVDVQESHNEILFELSATDNIRTVNRLTISFACDACLPRSLDKHSFGIRPPFNSSKQTTFTTPYWVNSNSIQLVRKTALFFGFQQKFSHHIIRTKWMRGGKGNTNGKFDSVLSPLIRFVLDADEIYCTHAAYQFCYAQSQFSWVKYCLDTNILSNIASLSTMNLSIY